MDRIVKKQGVRMDGAKPEMYYADARKRALKEYARNVSKGQSGYLPSLEDLLQNVEIVSEVFIGTVDVPLKKIIGTNSHARSTSFAANFMPLLRHTSEFGQKWTELCRSHLEEGIREPIKVYEYLNWFYVVEGNKRVSVLKYFDAFSFSAKVTRLIPKKDESDLNIRIYYEFLDFNKKTGINCIWFSKENSFKKLLEYMGSFHPDGLLYENKYRYFTNAVYLPFRKIYMETGGDRLPITTGDAFLEYIHLYGIPADIYPDKLKSRLKKLFIELEHMARQEKAVIQTEPLPVKGSNIAATLATLVIPKKKLKIAFAYAKSLQQSAWTYSHDLGRQHVDKILKEQVETSFVDNVPEDGDAYKYLKELAEKGADVVFATSPAFISATLKAALEYPNVRFFNCSETHSFKHVNTYFGRIYEARFLAGVIAGSMTQSDKLGYIGTCPVPEVVCGINAFALGAAMVNPGIKVKVEWTCQWDSHEMSENAGTHLISSGVDIISHHNTLANREISPEYGVYSMVCDVDMKKCVPGEYLAAPVWNWGIFYEKIIKSLLNDTWKAITDIFGENQKLVNFWWGMDSGVVDFFYSKRLVPRQTQKLVNLLKKAIANNSFQPFTGPVYDRMGVLRLKEDEAASHEQVLSMDWFVDAVESELPEFDIKGLG